MKLYKVQTEKWIFQKNLQKFSNEKVYEKIDLF